MDKASGRLQLHSHCNRSDSMHIIALIVWRFATDKHCANDNWKICYRFVCCWVTFGQKKFISCSHKPPPRNDGRKAKIHDTNWQWVWMYKGCNWIISIAHNSEDDDRQTETYIYVGIMPWSHDDQHWDECDEDNEIYTNPRSGCSRTGQFSIALAQINFVIK